MAGRRLIVIIDGAPDAGAAEDHIAEWQRQALATLGAEDRLTLLVCTNTSLKRQPLRFPLYYALNLLAVRNPLTRAVRIHGLAASIEGRHHFASEQDGAWQKLPDAIITQVIESGADAVIKLGMGLMRVPSDLTLPILSWHHGDPEHFRGRPAGFWELLTGRKMIGQIVQVIGNRLDAGTIVAFAETRAIPYSWRASLIEAFRHSSLLLAPALDNALAGRSLPKPTTGRNYRLPPNLAVIRLVVKLGTAKLRRLAYGALFEKRWQISTAPVASDTEAAAIVSGNAELPAATTWWTPPVPKGCSFIADPFFAGEGGAILVEALSARKGTGEIHRVSIDGSSRISTDPGHHSYPALVSHGGETYCVPEIAQWSGPAAYRWQDGWARVAALDIAGSPQLTDPTFLSRDGRLYLFANVAVEGSNVLRLWSAEGLFARFTQHPASPIRISPRGSRMGGALLQADGQTLRIGQDFTREYGDGLIAFAIDALTPESYQERELGTFRLTDRKGPHTFNLAPDGKTVLFDWYRNGFTPLAGIRRAMARLRRA